MSSAANPLFGRKWRITVVPPEGDATVLSDSDFDVPLRVRFEISQPCFAAFWFADLEIFNLNEGLEHAVLNAGERTQVIIEAGYQNGSFGQIFKGYVFQPMFSRENVTDFKVTLHCVTGRLELSQNFVFFTSGPGASQIDLVRRMASQAHNKFQVASLSDGFKSATLPRGKVIFGTPGKYLDQIAADNNMQWFVGDDGLHVGSAVAVSDATEALVLTPNTGLVGTPQQTDQGVNFRALLDPRLRVTLNPVTQVKLDMAVVEQQKKYPGGSPSVLDRDGYYNIAGVRYIGDTRGNEWYVEVTGLTTAQGKLAAMMRTGKEYVNGGY